MPRLFRRSHHGAEGGRQVRQGEREVRDPGRGDGHHGSGYQGREFACRLAIAR